MRGKVLYFADQKGWGFIKREDGQENAFVHKTDLIFEGIKTLRTGDAVEFDVREDTKGPRAINVQRI